jgi:hypothetical protein
MNLNNIFQNFGDLEIERKEAHEIVMHWYDDPEPLDQKVTRLQRRWLNEVLL